jgi:hypothetical protein
MTPAGRSRGDRPAGRYQLPPIAKPTVDRLATAYLT